MSTYFRTGPFVETQPVTNIMIFESCKMPDKQPGVYIPGISVPNNYNLKEAEPELENQSSTITYSISCTHESDETMNIGNVLIFLSTTHSLIKNS